MEGTLIFSLYLFFLFWFFFLNLSFSSTLSTLILHNLLDDLLSLLFALFSNWSIEGVPATRGRHQEFYPWGLMR